MKPIRSFDVVPTYEGTVGLMLDMGDGYIPECLTLLPDEARKLVSNINYVLLSLEAWPP